MPPQGESTGYAIEDGVLIAHVLQRHSSRTVPQLFEDYEKLRRPTINKLYKETMARWAGAAREDSGYITTLIVEWITGWVLMLMNMRTEDHFSSDVTKLELPA